MRRYVTKQHGKSVSPQSGKRSAYTLVEMMLVLAVIGTLAAVTWPSVLRMQADHDLSSAAEQVRLQLAAARTKAIKSGVKYQFLYEPKGRHFAVVPLEPELQSMPAVGNGAGAAKPASTSKGQSSSAGELSTKLSFLAPNAGSTLPASSQKISAASFQGLDNAGTLSSIGWSEPVVFAPDGSAMDAVITIQDNRRQRIELNVRGLTGATATGAMQQGSAR